MLLSVFWNPHPVAFHLGPIAIQWYGLMWGTGLMTVFFIGQYIMKALNKDDDKLTIMIQYVFIFGLIGARLLQVLYYHPEQYVHQPLKAFAVWEGGLASHGGVIGAIIGMFIFCWRNREISLLWLMDMSAVAGLTLAALIRFGNLLNSEIVGKVTGTDYGFIFPQYGMEPRHPTVLYESIAYLLLQVVMLLLFRKYKDTKAGLYTAVFFICLFGVRFLLEFTKEPEGELIFNSISKTQVLNLPFILVGLVILFLSVNNKLRYPSTEQHG